MSHSTVLVVVRKAEDIQDAYSQVQDALEPFYAELCVPHIEWLEDEKAVEESVSKAVEFSGCSPERPEKGSEAEREYLRKCVGSWNTGDEDDGRYDAETGRFGYFTTSNPRSRWDWYVLGGRWGGFFQVKEGVGDETATLGDPGVFGRAEGFQTDGRADLARKDAIDFAAMRLLSTAEAEMSYDKFEEVTKGMQVPPTFKEVRIKHGA